MRDRRGPIAAVLTVLAAAAVLAADTYAPAAMSPPEPAVVVAAGEPVAGNFVCGVGDASRDEVSLIAARPAGGGASPAQVDRQRFTEGSQRVEAEPSIFPGAASTSSYGPGDTDDEDEVSEEDLSGTWVAWRDAPVTAWREWHIDDHDDLPDATVAGPCAPPSSDRWIVPGLSTEGGDEARLRLANPFPGSATVAIGFLTPEGAEGPLVLRNITVPAQSVREIVVNDTLPERADLTAVVEVASGRMSVEGVQIARSEIGDIDGASLLQAAPEVAEEWTVPWVSDDDATSSWLWIANPGQRTAPVQLTLHTPDGGELLEGLAEVSVPPGEMRRVELADTFPEDVTVAAVSARSNGAPIVVSAGTRVSADDPAATGIAVQLGADAPDRSWVISGGSADGRTEAVHVVNPTGEGAVVDVALFNGVASLQPSELQDLTVSAGSSVVVELDEVLDERSAWSAFVTTSSGEVVVGRVGRSTLEGLEEGLEDDGAEDDEAEGDGDAEDDGAEDDEAESDGDAEGDAAEGDAEDDGEAEDDAAGDDAGTGSASDSLRLVVVTGVPSAAWSSKGSGLAATMTDGLVRHLRTATGISAPTGLEILDGVENDGSDPDLQPEPQPPPEGEPGQPDPERDQSDAEPDPSDADDDP